MSENTDTPVTRKDFEELHILINDRLVALRRDKDRLIHMCNNLIKTRRIGGSWEELKDAIAAIEGALTKME